MAEPTLTMADLLQGRRVNAPYAPAMSEFTTPNDLQRERISSAFGWDVGRPGLEFARRAFTQLPLAARAPMAGPMMSPRPTAAPAAAPSEPGPWTPGYMEQWLQGRYQPAARPQGWQADSRFGTTDRPGFHWTDVPAGRLNRFDFSDPLNRSQLLELGKGVGAAGAAGGVGGAAGMYVTDTLYHGEPWETASWRALAGPLGEPPSWWPQPPAGERPLPPSGPQPPSRLREGW
jgi:hypothetical protein